MTDLMTLDQVKQKLDLPLDDLDLDDEISWVMDGVNQWLLETMQLDLDGGQSYTEIHRRVQLGQQLYLNRRPVASIESLTGRVVGGSAQALDFDLIDPTLGIVVLLGGDGLRGWPPVESERPRWFRWRDAQWPLITVAYTTAAFGVPKDLSDAAAAIAAAYWMIHKAGLRVYSSLGSVIERYSSDHIPGYCLPILARYQRRTVYGTP